MHRRANVLCEDAGFEPKVLLSPDQLITSYNMACSGMGIAFVTDALISAASGEGCIFYRLDGMHTTRTMSIGFKRNRYLSSACSAFIETAKKTHPAIWGLSQIVFLFFAFVYTMFIIMLYTAS